MAEEITDSNCKMLECPICFDYLIPPFIQCTNGHLLCNDCIARVSDCPLCRVTLNKKLPARNLYMEDMARKYKYPCPYSSLGCPSVLKLDDIANHKFDCQFSMINYCSMLKIPRCRFPVTAGNFLYHVQTKHQICSRFVESKPIEIFQKGNISPGHGSFVLNWKPIMLLHQEHKFCLLTKVKDGSIIWDVVVFGSKATAKQFTASITVSSCHNQDQAFQMRGPIRSIKSVSEVEASHFSVPIYLLKQFTTTINREDNFWWPHGYKTGEEEWKLDILLQNSCETISENSPSDEFIANKPSDVGRCLNNSTKCVNCGFLFSNENYKCVKCEGYTLCRKCVDCGVHQHHLFLRVPEKESLDNLTIKITTSSYGIQSILFELPEPKKPSTPPPPCQHTRNPEDSTGVTADTFAENFMRYLFLEVIPGDNEVDDEEFIEDLPYLFGTIDTTNQNIIVTDETAEAVPEFTECEEIVIPPNEIQIEIEMNDPEVESILDDLAFIFT